MLTLFTGHDDRDCEGMSRRSFVQAGTLGIGGLTLPSLLATRATAAARGESVRKKSVVVLCLAGGATHVETFDPKMTAPVEYRSLTGEVQTVIPGVTFGGDFPNLARLADRMAVVRSYRHGNSSHAAARQIVMTGGNRMKAGLGSVYARIAGTSSPTSGLPNNSLISAAVVDPKKYKAANLGPAIAPGTLGSAYSVFDPSAGGDVLNDMRLSIPVARLDDRRALLGRLDRVREQVEASDLLQGADRFHQQAFDVILGGTANAFDISRESPATIRRYSTAKLDDANGAGALGHQMLVARKLVESGCGFVTVGSNGWDMHAKLADGMKTRGRAVDVACAAAFVSDLEERGLLDDTLLVITGESGRTPRINKNAGRDHWGNLCTLAFAGGGYRMEQVVGESDRTASVPATTPVTTAQLMATIMHLLVDPALVRLQSSMPADVNQMLAEGEPIPQLV